MRHQLLGLIAWLTWAAALSAQPVFTVTDLGTLGGTVSQANGINDRGQVVGVSTNAAGVSQAFLWSPGGTAGSTDNPQMRSLGTIGPAAAAATAMNNLGQVVGSCWAPTDPSAKSAFLWTPGGTGGSAGNPQMLGLGTLGGYRSSATGINDRGQVVGWSATALATGVSGPDRAYLWTPHGSGGPASNPQMKELGALGLWNSAALSVNSAGQVVGYTDSPNAEVRAFLYANGVMTELGTLFGPSLSSGVESAAYAINDAGTVAGWSGSLDGCRAFIDRGGTMTNLGSFGPRNFKFQALSINSLDHVVGGQDFTDIGIGRAFLFDKAGIHDLNGMIDPASGWTLVQAAGINDFDQIVGYGTVGGSTHAFLLTPVPEPGGLTMIAAVAAAAVGFRRKRARR